MGTQQYMMYDHIHYSSIIYASIKLLMTNIVFDHLSVKYFSSIDYQNLLATYMYHIIIYVLLN